MPTANVFQQVAIGGLTVSASASREQAGSISQDLTGDFALDAGVAGTLSTRTDNDTGVLTVASGHGIVDTDTVDVYWDGGVRYGVDVTAVTATTISINVGAGDNLPAEDTAIVVCKQTALDVDVVGDQIDVFAVAMNRRCHVDVQQANGTSIKAVDLPAAEGYMWWSDSGVTNPFAGVTVGAVKISNGDSSNSATGGLAVLYDSIA
jgi:hypothetical protein